MTDLNNLRVDATLARASADSEQASILRPERGEAEVAYLIDGWFSSVGAFDHETGMAETHAGGLDAFCRENQVA